MYCLLLMLCSWIPHAFSVSSAPPAPERLILKSVEFNHVLRWERGAGTSPEVTYRVSFQTDRVRCCKVVDGCERVLEPLLCDLTEAFSDPNETYHLRVTALHGSEESATTRTGFLPIRDTELQPPVLRVAPCNASVCVEMDTPVPRLRSVYEPFQYELKVVQKATQWVTTMPFWFSETKKIDITAGSQYCISVRFADQRVERNSGFSPAQCVSAPGPSHTTATVLPAVLVPVLLGLLLLALIYTAFICRQKPILPSVLTSVLHSEQKLEVSCHPAVSSLLLIEAASPDGHTEYCSSEADSGDEQELVKVRGTSNTAQYTCKPFQSSGSGSGSGTGSGSGPASASVSGSGFGSGPASASGSGSGSGFGSASASASGSVSASVTGSGSGSGSAASGAVEGPEEVDLLTLTFSRDNETETGAALLSDMELPVCEVIEEQTEPEAESEEDCFQSGYMQR